MKKYTLILAIGVVLTLMSCGSGSTATQPTDSTAVIVDSANVGSAMNDSTAKIPTDSTVKEVK
jgi:hypothetical protein